ncbi:MAG: hypothetical protein IKF71_00885 [Bacilli bacterium]|nr:hypothetical protein [Bacilli bacterium]
MKQINGKEDFLDSTQQKRIREMSEVDVFSEALHNNEMYDISWILLPDCYAIKLYDYLLRLVELENVKGEVKKPQRLKKIKDILLKLELLPSVQQHIWEITPTEQDAEIDAMVALVEEKQKLRKMGPVRKYIYQKQKEKKSK